MPPVAVAPSRATRDLRPFDDGIWDEVQPEDRGVATTRCSGLLDDLDAEQVAPAAEHDAIHVMGG